MTRLVGKPGGDPRRRVSFFLAGETAPAPALHFSISNQRVVFCAALFHAACAITRYQKIVHCPWALDT
jgi:hypothetical protein